MKFSTLWHWQWLHSCPFSIHSYRFIICARTKRPCSNCSNLDDDTVNYSYTGLRVIPEFAHISDPENFSPAQKQLTVCFVQSSVFGYTGFLIYRTLNVSPNQSGITAIDCVLWEKSQSVAKIDSVRMNKKFWELYPTLFWKFAYILFLVENLTALCYFLCTTRFHCAVNCFKGCQQ